MSIVADIVTNEKSMEGIRQLEAALKADPKVGVLLEAAEDVKDVFQAVRKFLKVKFEVFETYFNEAMDYFKEDKVALQDEMLENVAGGFTLSTLWNRLKTIATAVAVGAAAGAVCGVAGGVAFSPLFAAGGAIFGLVVGGCEVCFGENSDNSLIGIVNKY